MQANEISQSAPANATEHIEKDAGDREKGKVEGRRKKVVVVGLGMVGMPLCGKPTRNMGPLTKLIIRIVRSF